ncbi:MAG: hypothetical protein J5875_10250 [Paludibacteraceae bacterium]|nr:hypothetical protein [Paludibacteraceae bacterium]
MGNQLEGQEIDLLKVFSLCVKHIVNFFAKMGRWLVWCLRSAYQHRKYMVGAMVCAIAFTAYWARPTHRGYQMENELRINVLDAYFFSDMLANLNHMCLNEDRTSLAKSLGVGLDVAKKLSSSNAFYIVDKMCDGTPDEVCYDTYKADTTKVIMKDRLLVSLVISDTAFIDSISNGIIRYFNKNPYVCKSNGERVSQIDDQILSIDNELLMLDSLRKYEYFKKAATEMKLNGPLIVSEKNKELYYNDILSLEKLRNEKQYARAVYSNSAVFIRDFVLVKVQNKYIPTFILSFFVFVVISLGLAFVVDEKARIKAFLER